MRALGPLRQEKYAGLARAIGARAPVGARGGHPGRTNSATRSGRFARKSTRPSRGPKDSRRARGYG